MLERRVHPKLPRKRLLCFYPMSKTREGADNWSPRSTTTSAAGLMGGHGELGREVRGPRDPADHGSTGLRRLGVGRDALWRRPRAREGHRLRDALRRGLGALRNLRAVHGRATSCHCARRWRSPTSPWWGSLRGAKCLHSAALLLVHIGVWRGLAGPDPVAADDPYLARTINACGQAENVRTWRTPCSARRVVPTRVSSANHHGSRNCHPGVRLRHLGSDPAWRSQTLIARQTLAEPDPDCSGR